MTRNVPCYGRTIPATPCLTGVENADRLGKSIREGRDGLMTGMLRPQKGNAEFSLEEARLSELTGGE